MSQEIIDKVALDFMRLFPFLYKNLLSAEKELPGNDSRFQISILALLKHKGPSRIIDIGKRLLLSKPYMSTLISRLIQEGKAKKQSDKQDKRAMIITITKKGEKTLLECKQLIREQLSNELKQLKKEDIKQLHESLQQARIIMQQL